jgi:hypothetical protein
MQPPTKETPMAFTPPPDMTQKFFEITCQAAGFRHDWGSLGEDQKKRYAEGAQAFADYLRPSLERSVLADLEPSKRSLSIEKTDSPSSTP